MVQRFRRARDARRGLKIPLSSAGSRSRRQKRLLWRRSLVEHVARSAGWPERHVDLRA